MNSKIKTLITLSSSIFIFSPSFGFIDSFLSSKTSNKNAPTIKKFLNDRYSDDVIYTKSNFEKLGNWDTGQQLVSFNAFKSSCYKILDNDKPEYQNWIKICKKTITLEPKTNGEARIFFESNFTPYEIINDGSAQGLFTGYYEPIMKGSLTKSAEYSIPIYRTPKDLVKHPVKDDSFIYGHYQDSKFVPYYSREEISKHNYFSREDILAWVSSKVDRFFLQIQGSGRIEVPNGDDVLLGYDSQNGHPYRPIGRYLLDKNYMEAKNMSMQSIKAWLAKNPSKIDEVLNYDPSFVFFRYINAKNAIGAQGVELTPGYSLAVDNRYYLYGMPIWLETDYFKDENRNKEILSRLMITQDTGGAIRGPIRGDIFWGHGKEAEFNAGHMRNYGNIWILLPNYS